MLRLYNEGIGQKLFITDINAIMAIDVFVEEGFELADAEVCFVQDLGQPDVFPTRCVVAFYVLEE
jgi:hypothetical protein